MIRLWRRWRLRAWERRLRYAQIRMKTFEEHQHGWDALDLTTRLHLLQHDLGQARYEVESLKAILQPEPKSLPVAIAIPPKEE